VRKEVRKIIELNPSLSRYCKPTQEREALHCIARVILIVGGAGSSFLHCT
jgi:hypothetical protein